jgi:hypothetical protein
VRGLPPSYPTRRTQRHRGRDHHERAASESAGQRILLTRVRNHNGVVTAQRHFPLLAAQSALRCGSQQRYDPR